MTEPALPAEYWARRYMEQPWGGKAKMPYRSLVAQIGRELNDSLRRCPECEEPYIPTIAAWPTRRGARSKCRGRRYLICPYCGHKSLLYLNRWKKAPIYTPEEMERIFDLYGLGMTPRQIGKLMGCHPNTVSHYVREADIPRHPHGGSTPLRGVSHTDMELIRHLYECRGWTQKQIAAHMKVSKYVIATRVKRGGMVPLGASPPKKRKEPPEGRKRELLHS